MNIFPNKIKIVIFDKTCNKPVSGIAVQIRLFSNHKNDYYFMLPLSDDEGCIDISNSWLREKINKERSIFIMDYASELDDCKAQIELIVLDQQSLDRVISNMSIYQDFFDNSNTDIEKYRNASNNKYMPKREIFILDSLKSDIEIPVVIENQTIGIL